MLLAGLVAEEGRRFMEEELELVVVHPVTGARDLNQAAMANRLKTGVAFRDGEEALKPPEKEDGGCDLPEKLDRILDVMAVGRDGARVIIEFP